jgi:hypothetical protein
MARPAGWERQKVTEEEMVKKNKMKDRSRKIEGRRT